jgi:GNAT superfamily N-acetyltransferase
MSEIIPADGRVLDQILDASHALWSEGLSRSAYARHYEAQRQTAWGRAHLERFALVRNEIVLASAKVYDLSGILDGKPLRIAGIGAVFTQPEHRGRGYARDLIERLLERSAEADVALLFSEIDPAYYAHLGFVVVPTTELVLGLKETPRPGAPATMVRAGGDRDLPGIEAMGRDRAAAFRFHLDRDRDLIQYSIAKKRLLAGLDQSGKRELQFFVVEEGDSAVAYAVLSVLREGGKGRTGSGAVDDAGWVLSDPPIWALEECGDRDPSGARVGAILQALVAREPASRPTIRGSLPPGFLPPQLTIVEAQPSPVVMMVRGLKMPVPALAMSDVMYWHGDVF